MKPAIERRKPAGHKPAGLQDTAIERALNITEISTCNNSKPDWFDELIQGAVTSASSAFIYGGRQL